MLSIRTTPLVLSYEIKNAQLNMTQKEGRFEGRTILPEIRIKTTNPKLKIDQSECFNEAGSKTNSALLDEYISYSNSMHMKGLERVVSQGNELAKIENGGNPIPSQAEYNVFDQYKKEFNIGTVPRSRPKIEVIEGNVDISVREGKIDKEYIRGGVEYEYIPGYVKYVIDSYNSISIEYKGKNVNTEV